MCAFNRLCESTRRSIKVFVRVGDFNLCVTIVSSEVGRSACWEQAIDIASRIASRHS